MTATDSYCVGGQKNSPKVQGHSFPPLPKPPQAQWFPNPSLSVPQGWSPWEDGGAKSSETFQSLRAKPPLCWGWDQEGLLKPAPARRSLSQPAPERNTPSTKHPFEIKGVVKIHTSQSNSNPLLGTAWAKEPWNSSEGSPAARHSHSSVQPARAGTCSSAAPAQQGSAPLQHILESADLWAGTAKVFPVCLASSSSLASICPPCLAGLMLQGDGQTDQETGSQTYCTTFSGTLQVI